MYYLWSVTYMYLLHITIEGKMKRIFLLKIIDYRKLEIIKLGKESERVKVNF